MALRTFLDCRMPNERLVTVLSVSDAAPVQQDASSLSLHTPSAFRHHPLPVLLSCSFVEMGATKSAAGCPTLPFNLCIPHIQWEGTQAHSRGCCTVPIEVIHSHA